MDFLSFWNKISEGIANKNKLAFENFNQNLIAKNSLPKIQTPIKRQKTESQDSQVLVSNQKELYRRKKSLLMQLELIDSQIKKVSEEKNRVKQKRIQTKAQEEQKYRKATDLIHRMNQRRQELNDIKNRQRLNAQSAIRQTLKQMEQNQLQIDRQKLKKRQQISRRINDRKTRGIARQKFIKQANTLIQEIESYKISLPMIVNHENSTLSQISDRTLPAKKYFSPFFSSIKQQQISKKRAQYLKSYEKQKIRERQIQYSDKVRGKSHKNRTVFMTE